MGSACTLWKRLKRKQFCCLDGWTLKWTPTTHPNWKWRILSSSNCPKFVADSRNVFGRPIAGSSNIWTCSRRLVVFLRWIACRMVLQLERRSGNGIELKFYFSLSFGTKKNNQMCIPITVMNWNAILPCKFFLRYNARSTMIKTNCSSNIIKKATGILFSSRYDATPPSPCDDWKRKSFFLQNCPKRSSMVR